MKSDKTPYTSFDQLPLALSAEDIAATLNISRGSAYALLHSESFPTIHIGKRMVSPRDQFLAWMNQQIKM